MALIMAVIEGGGNNRVWEGKSLVLQIHNILRTQIKAVSLTTGYTFPSYTTKIKCK